MTTAVVARKKRIESIDILRGIVMVLMALDHVRDFFGPTPYGPEDVAQTYPLLFFTRWITHFCAPAFVFLAGTSAYLYGAKRTRSELSRFLLTRGLWLILIEFTIITVAWFFAYPFPLGQVIWAIGLSMIVLAALVWLPIEVVAGIGLLIIFGHNLLDGVSFEGTGGLGKLFTEQGPVPLFGGSVRVLITYPVFAWIGVMAMGFAFGALFKQVEDTTRRHTIFLAIGGAATVLFLVFRSFNIYGDPAVWSVSDRGPVYTVLSFLNTTKYPPSLLFLAMTLGPAIAALPFYDRMPEKIKTFFITFGRVPFFYYVVHLYVIHGLSWILDQVLYGQEVTFVSRAVTGQPWPESYEHNILIVYVAWFVVVALLYYPCKRFMEYKKRHTSWWLSYL